MQNEPSINVFDEIQKICRDYRRKLKQGAVLRTETLLELVDEKARPVLFQNLLHIDLEFRRRQGENPNSEDYLKRFPQFGELIRQAFFESTSSAISQTDEKTVLFAAPPAQKIGEYELQRELGRGGFGVVYEALHRQRNELVALKTLPSDFAGPLSSSNAAERLHKFRKEFRSLSEVNHRNLVGMQTLEMDGNQWFITMDLVEGTDFLEYVRPHNRLEEHRLRQTLPQLVQGIAALHARHIVHRDLKPSNVLVEADGRVVILDFGLVAELQHATGATVSMHSQHFVGTPRYAAPEQMMGTRTGASDWYALGVMLYEAITGRPPFEGSHAEVMLKKQSEDAPPIPGDSPFADLAQLIDQLLQRTPEDRPSLEVITQVLGITIESPSHDSTDSSLEMPTGSTETILIGRETQLAELEKARQELIRTREPVVVFVRGRSGEGKTSLSETFLDPLRRDAESLVLSGRCYDRESVPFKAVDCLIDALVGYLRSVTSDKARGLLPDDTPFLAHLFPVLRRVEAIAELNTQHIAGIDSRQIRHRAFSALRELFATIGQSTPLILFIDDLQWGDADSAAVLHEVLLPPHPPPVMLLGSYRSDEADESPFLNDWRRRNPEREQQVHELTVEVSPLNKEQCLTLFAARLGHDLQSLREQSEELFQGTQGNPYFLDHLIEGFDPQTGQFQAVQLREIIESKLRRLPDEAAPLLETIAVAGQAVKIEEVASASARTTHAFSTVTRMRSERLVRLIGDSEQQLVDTYHDKIRETVLSLISLEDRKTLHLQLAETIERNEGLDGHAVFAKLNSGEQRFSSNARVFDLSYHFSSADQAKKALVYATWAAENAKDHFAIEAALEQYDVARRFSADATRVLLYRIEAGYGEALTLAGQYAEATSVLEHAAEFAGNRLEKAKLEAAQAEIIYMSQSVAESVAAYQRVLRRLRVWCPRSRWEFMVSALFDPTLGRLYSFLRRHWMSERTRPPAKTTLAIRVFLLLARSIHFRTWFHATLVTSRAVNLAGPYSNSPLTAMCYALHGAGIMMSLGRYSRGERWFHRANAILKQSNHLQTQVFVARMHGYGLWGVARYEYAMECLSLAKELLESKVADAWAIVYVNYWMACVQFRMGDLADSEAYAKEAFELAVQLGQHRIAQSALDPWGRATGGNLPFEKLKSRFQKVPDDFTSTIQLLTAESHWHLYHQRTVEAVNVSEQACDLLRRHRLINVQTTSAISTLARALREHSESDQVDRRQTEVFQSRALKIAKWSVRIASILPLEKPVAFRELSLAYAAKGMLNKSLKYAKKSCAVAEKQKARYEYAQSLLLCGQLAQKLGRPNADEQIARAESELEKLSRGRDSIKHNIP